MFHSFLPQRLERHHIIPAVRRLALAAVVATAMGVLTLGLLGASPAAMAQAEPTLKQIYDTAAAGKLPEAQTMVQQVLVAHPKSAKAHFVQAELFARQGDMPRARAALAEADALEPGLPFVKPDVVQALRKQLQARPAAAAAGTTALNASPGRTESATAPTAPATPGSSFPTGLGLALGGAAVAAAIYFGLRKKSAAAPTPGAAGAGFRDAVPDQNFGQNFRAPPVAAGSMGGLGSGLSGPQTFGTHNGTNPGAAAPSPYGQNYAQPLPAGQAAGGMMSGMGGRVAGGLATGLAVGAGVMAAQAIGRSFSGNETAGHAGKAAADSGNTANPGSLAGDAGSPMGGNQGAGNQDMGGQNFGFNDGAGSAWDDAGSADSFSADAGGGDWDV